MECARTFATLAVGVGVNHTTAHPYKCLVVLWKLFISAIGHLVDQTVTSRRSAYIETLVIHGNVGVCDRICVN